MSKQEKNNFICFPVRGSEKTKCPNLNELARSRSLQPLTIVVKINKKIERNYKSKAE